ncbi:endonuclease/exonuclease/phosphatase family protein [Yoonia sediminilitoris]|uniref:Endonuclease/exonuclease/phosphatase (EEP) superfamily protein YafD n=1 Tax=Yoonia sediminilitoris TaxID=1286148 RepID=A0A2T6KDR1_9RHOB|nr:endonuclease/exonuclease/phosphatase family protein [Yoonia sediminilitoris]PUB13160.1 endonuclease/exonuclease/phosphatase (EEP) superfamily protein YafD [Yoonia sediminilitoris]RCW94495.1 endonuclease/exonuclease/phosphatase (EEP) superfamily protein YafD [Yoonia sediminilitoris]
MIKWLSFIIALVLCVGVFSGFLGRFHPLGDSLSLLRLPLGVGCVLLVIASPSRSQRLVCAMAAVAAGVTTVPLFFAGAPNGDLTLYSKNVWYRNSQLDALAQDMRASGAEVITLQEVSHRNRMWLTGLADIYPHQHLCRNAGWSGIAVLSKHPIRKTRCSSRRAVAAAQIARDGQAIWVVSIHLAWAYPYGHETALQSALAVLDGLTGPVVIGGDFNVFPWASSVGALTAATATQLAGPLRPTYWLKGVPLPLDHAYSPGGGQVTYQPELGSDHQGVLARLRIFP